MKSITSESSKSEVKRRALSVTFAFLVVIVSAAIFRAKAWSQINYSATDGLAMAKEVQLKVFQDQNPGMTLDEMYTIPVPDPKYLANIGKDGTKEDCVSLCTYHFFRPVTPAWLKWIQTKTGKKPQTTSVGWSDITQSKEGEFIHHTHIGGILGLPGPHKAEEVRRLCQEILKDLEPNSHLSLSEDFVTLYVNGQVRVYSAAKLSPRMKELVAKVAGVPAKEIWKDVSHTVWDSN